ncbi:hypothetical protein I4U23_013688 [Adineta vaga]|nr:hypothetical protein I4U23_013688 [Adineta vaga]
MPDTDVVPPSITNQLPPRTTTSHRWPRKWATLGGRGSGSTTVPPVHLDEPEFREKINGHHVNGNGNGNGHPQHRHSTSLFRKSSTISRTNGTTMNNDTPSLKKSRSLINVLRSKLNSPAVLRRFRTKSRENAKQVIIEINGDHAYTNEQEKVQSQTDDDQNKKIRKRDPSPMKRFTSRLAQLTRSSTHTSIETEQQTRHSPTPPTHDKDQVDHINACYDEIRAKYFDNNNNNNNNSTTKPNGIGILSQHPCAPLPTDRLKEMLSTTTTSSIDYYDRPNLTNGDVHNRSLSTISMNGSLLSHDFLNNSQPYVQSSPPKTSDDPLLQARKQSNIKLNCMLSGYGFTTPFGNHEKMLNQQHDLFKFHHYHDVGKRKFDWNFTSNNNRMYSSLRARPMSRSIDSFRRATTTLENDVLPTDPTVETNNHQPITNGHSSSLSSDNELIIREDGDLIESEQIPCTSTVHVTPAAALHVKTFASSTSAVPDELENVPNGKDTDEHNQEFEKNFLRAVDRALGVVKKDPNHLLQPIYDIPKMSEDSDMNLVEMTERALSSFNNIKIFTDEEQKTEHIADDDEHRMDGNESPNVELFDRTGELYESENLQWQSSAVYNHQSSNGHHEQEHLTHDNDENSSIDDHVWSIVDDLTQKTQESLCNEPQVNAINN